MIDGMPVIDAVVHSYNFDPENFANAHGRQVCDSVYYSVLACMPPGMTPEREYFVRDWPMAETANMMFLESSTDIAVHHALPLFAFKDGGASFEKTLEAKRTWPDRFITYAGIDPLAGDRALEELERQVELLDPVGVKLYPNSWLGSEMSNWRMDDPEVAFPVFERAMELGIKVVAIHKAVPLGPVPMDPYRIDDIDRAAIAFPDLAFEIVHGGMAFVEETAFQLARFPNVWVNLEITCAWLATRPRLFEQAIADLLKYGGPAALERICWGTGAMAFHPQPLVEIFARTFDIRPSVAEGAALPPMDESAKRKILAENYARMLGLDLDAKMKRIENDEFATRCAENGGLYAPFSTTKAAGHLV